MVSLNVDCFSVAAQDNEPRVTFTTQKFSSVSEETPVLAVVRERLPLSAAMRLIFVDSELSDGMYSHYIIEPEK